MRQSDERYRLLAENVDDVIFTLDLSGRPTYFSPSVMRLLGYEPEEKMQHPIEQAFTPSSLAIVAQHLRETHTTVEAGQQVESSRLELECI